jgi:hypothetical protein
MADEPLLTLRVDGPATAAGRLPLAEVGRIAGQFQHTVERIALGLAGLTPIAGPRPRPVVGPVRLELRAVTSDPVTLVIGRVTADEGLLAGMIGPDSRHDPLLAALAALEVGFAAVAAGLRPAPEFGPTVLHGLVEMAAGVADGHLSVIILERPGRSPLRLDASMYAALRTARDRRTVAPAEIVGRMQMADFADRRCRIDTPDGSVTCTFDADLGAQVLAAMGEAVAATGAAERRGSAAEIRAMEIHTLRRLPPGRDPSSPDGSAGAPATHPVVGTPSLTDAAGLGPA